MDFFPAIFNSLPGSSILLVVSSEEEPFPKVIKVFWSVFSTINLLGIGFLIILVLPLSDPLFDISIIGTKAASVGKLCASVYSFPSASTTLVISKISVSGISIFRNLGDPTTSKVNCSTIPDSTGIIAFNKKYNIFEPSLFALCPST